MAFDAATYEIDPLTLTTPKARLEYLRDLLRVLPAEQFDMHKTGRDQDAVVGYCQSPACIGGWARAVFRVAAASLSDIGTSVLSLDRNSTERLFFPGCIDDGGTMGDGESAYDAAPADAADVLDHLIRTGEVDWSVARKEEAV